MNLCTVFFLRVEIIFNITYFLADVKGRSKKKKGGRSKLKDDDSEREDFEKENEPPSSVKRKVSGRNKKVVKLNPIFSSDDEDFS